MKVICVWTVWLLLIVVTCLVPIVASETQATLQGQELWMHVEVRGEGAENTNLNIPLGAAEAILALAPGTFVREGQLQLGSKNELPVNAIRAMWLELRDVEDEEFVTMRHQGRVVRFSREGAMVHVNMTDREGDFSGGVQVEVPVPVIDALLSADSDVLDVRAAIQEFSVLSGKMIRIVEEDRNVQIWIDSNPTQ